MTNDFSNKLDILADLWINYRNDEEFEDFMEYNDVGLPMAYLLANKLVKPTDESNGFIEETYSILLEALEVPDEEYESLDDLFVAANR